jgi:hypothetical protein
LVSLTKKGREGLQEINQLICVKTRSKLWMTNAWLWLKIIKTAPQPIY